MTRTVNINKKEYEALKADKARLDYLEKVLERGRIKLLGFDFEIPKQAMPVRNIIDNYRLNDKDF